MVMVIDFLETTDRAGSTATWQTVSGFLAGRPGFRDGQLVETFTTVQPRADFVLGSLCAWDSAEHWTAARTAARSDPAVLAALAAAPTRFTGLTTDLVDGSDHRFGPPSPGMVLLDIVYLAPAQVDGYAAMWRDANAHMATLPGYVGAGLYRNRKADDAIAFVNVAEWRSAELFFDAVQDARFLEIVDPFRDVYALLLTHRVARRRRPGEAPESEDPAASAGTGADRAQGAVAPGEAA